MAATGGAQAVSLHLRPDHSLNLATCCGDRYLQGAEPEPEPEAEGIEVRWKVKASSGDHASSVVDSILSCGGPGSTTADGSFDYSRCADDPTFRQCHSKACMGADWGQSHAEGKGRRRQLGPQLLDLFVSLLEAAEALLAQQDAAIAAKDKQLKAKDEKLEQQAEQLQHCA